MLGRGVDQTLAHSVDPVLFEDYVKDARDYVKLAVRKNGPLPADRGPQYVWGDALEILQDSSPDVRIVNLETSATSRGTPWPNKGIVITLTKPVQIISLWTKNLFPDVYL